MVVRFIYILKLTKIQQENISDYFSAYKIELYKNILNIQLIQYIFF